MRALWVSSKIYMPPKGGVASPRIFHGVAGASGIAMGRAVVIYPPADLESVPDRGTEDPEQRIRSNFIKLSWVLRKRDSTA
jgi:signal transduction protein with GAF and PtsI domain